MVDVKRPIDTIRKNIFSGSVCGFGTVDVGSAGAEEPD
jgi:hypothetical protein